MNALSIAITVCVMAGSTARVQAQCFSCATPLPIEPVIISDVCDTLHVSAAQKHAIADLYNTYHDDWQLLQDRDVATLAAREMNFASSARADDVAAYCSHVKSLIRQNNSVLKSLREVDQALFDRIAEALSDDQVMLLPAWIHQQQSRALTTAMAGRGHTLDLLRLIPDATENSEVRRACIEALLPQLADQKRALRVLHKQMMDRIAELYEDVAAGNVRPEEMFAMISAVQAEIATARATLADSLLRNVQQIIGEVAPHVARTLPLRSKLADDTPYDDAAIRSILDWHAYIEQSSLSQSAKTTCTAIVTEQADIAAALGEAIAATQTGSTTFYKAGTALAMIDGTINRSLFESIPFADYQQLLKARGAHKKQQELPMPPPPLRRADGIDLHPMSTTRFQALQRTLDLPLHSDNCLVAHDASIEQMLTDELIQAGLPIEPGRCNDAEAAFTQWMSAKSQGLARADAIDADLIAAIAPHATPSRIALAHTQARTWRRQGIRNTASLEVMSPQFGNVNIISSASDAGLDLDDPTLAELLLRHAATISSTIEQQGLCRLHRVGTPGAANASDQTGLSNPNEVMATILSNQERAFTESVDAINAAVHAIASEIPDKTASAWRRSMFKSVWSGIGYELEAVRASHDALTQAMPETAQAQLESAFAELLTDALVLQDEIISLLVDQPLQSNAMTMAGNVRVEVQARLQRQTQRISQWRDEVNGILSEQLAIAAHP
ncbi:MAG: hypothetical protein GY876_05885 [Planctomycetes bacterium]|nr:hypothetical protein [Planctomycetota bacterium]